MCDKAVCAQCRKVACTTRNYSQGDKHCPTIHQAAVIEAAKAEYDKLEIRNFAYQAMLQHNEAVLKLPEGGAVPRNPRVEEVAQFAKKVGYKKTSGQQ